MNPHKNSKSNEDKPLYKYSVYMQSRDHNWLNRNLSEAVDDDPEPIEEDIRD